MRHTQGGVKIEGVVVQPDADVVEGLLSSGMGSINGEV